ncbi:MAG: amidohydrolase family protein [Desulfobacterales bacterium]|nr:amidohydrolase family protein [Desulfobacterales bacterium]
MSDLLISNARIIDGTGEAAFPGHVLISNQHIEAVIPGEGTRDLPRTEKVLDARGLALAPGFIDCHSHFDWMLPLADHPDVLHPVMEQGITTLVTGHCGFSPAPSPTEIQPILQEFAEFVLPEPMDFAWTDMAGFLDQLAGGPGLLFNTIQLVGHGPLHLMVTRDLKKRPDAQGLEDMARMAAKAMDQGAHGLSLGLMYPPGMFSPREGLLALARVTAQADKLLSVHLKAYSRYSMGYPIIPFLGRPHNLKALEEALDIALETGVKLQISHFIFVGRSSWKTADKAISMVERAREKGARVMWDIYPHHCGNSYLNVFIPDWFMADLDNHLQTPWSIRRLKLELQLTTKLLGFSYDDVQIMDAHYPGGEKYNGMDLTQIARDMGCHPLDAILELIRKSGGQALQLTYGYSGSDEEDQIMAQLATHPCTLFETDTLLKGKGFPNPASYGAFPRILGRFARDKGWLSLEGAVAKITGNTAQWLGLGDRGILKAGNRADLVLFDPNTIEDTTSREKTASRPRGIETVWVNGRPTVDRGRYLGNARFGEVVPDNSPSP